MVLIEIVRDLTAGTLGGCAGIVSGQPLDTIKVRLQAPAASGQAFRGIAHCAAETDRFEGVRGLFKGMVPPLVGNAPLNAILFAANGVAVRTASEFRGVPESKLGGLDQYLALWLRGWVRRVHSDVPDGTHQVPAAGANRKGCGIATLRRHEGLRQDTNRGGGTVRWSLPRLRRHRAARHALVRRLLLVYERTANCNINANFPPDFIC